MQDHKDTNEEESSPTIEEVEMAIQKLKNYEAPGADKIPDEIFKYGGHESVKHLHNYKGYLAKGKDTNGMECKYNLSHP